jgi:hypothetical protein
METINSLFQKLFFSEPEIHFSIEKDIFSNEVLEEIKFNFYSSKDISGLIKLDSIKNKKCIFIKIYLIIYPADNLTVFDKNNQLEKIKEKYEKFYVKENNFILKNFNNKEILLKIDDKSFISHFINFYTYLFFILICASGLYDIFYYYYLDKDFSDRRKNIIIIRKLYSSRYNLSDSLYQKKYEKLNPCVRINETMYDFDENKSVHVMQGVLPILPSEDELKNLRDYKTSDEIDKLIKTGIEFKKDKIDISTDYLVKIDQNKSQVSQYGLNISNND